MTIRTANCSFACVRMPSYPLESLIKDFNPSHDFDIASGISGGVVGSIYSEISNTDDTNSSFKFTPNQGKGHLALAGVPVCAYSLSGTGRGPTVLSVTYCS
jgi:hypothetical protein